MYSYANTVILTDIIISKASIGEPSSGCMVEKVFPVRPEIAPKRSSYVVIVSGVHRRVAENKN